MSDRNLDLLERAKDLIELALEGHLDRDTAERVAGEINDVLNARDPRPTDYVHDAVETLARIRSASGDPIRTEVGQRALYEITNWLALCTHDQVAVGFDSAWRAVHRAVKAERGRWAGIR